MNVKGGSVGSEPLRPEWARSSSRTAAFQAAALGRGIEHENIPGRLGKFGTAAPRMGAVRSVAAAPRWVLRRLTGMGRSA